jgi:hypothetical protein
VPDDAETEEYTPQAFGGLPRGERDALWTAYASGLHAATRTELRNCARRDFVVAARRAAEAASSASRARDELLRTRRLASTLRAYQAAQFTLTSRLPVPPLAAAEAYNRGLTLHSERVAVLLEDSMAASVTGGETTDASVTDGETGSVGGGSSRRGSSSAYRGAASPAASRRSVSPGATPRSARSGARSSAGRLAGTKRAAASSSSSSSSGPAAALASSIPPAERATRLAIARQANLVRALRSIIPTFKSR